MSDRESAIRSTVGSTPVSPDGRRNGMSGARNALTIAFLLSVGLQDQFACGLAAFEQLVRFRRLRKRKGSIDAQL